MYIEPIGMYVVCCGLMRVSGFHYAATLIDSSSSSSRSTRVLRELWDVQCSLSLSSRQGTFTFRSLLYEGF